MFHTKQRHQTWYNKANTKPRLQLNKPVEAKISNKEYKETSDVYRNNAGTCLELSYELINARPINFTA
jgi:hypothetical protein